MKKLDSVIIKFDLAKKQSKEIPWEEIKIDPLNKENIYWIHCNLREKAKFLQIAEKLQLSDEIKNLCLNAMAPKKIIFFEDALAIQISDQLANTLSSSESLFGNLTIYLTTEYCLTASEDVLATPMKFMEEYPQNIRFALTPGFIFFLMLDNVINDYSEIFEKYEIISDRLDYTIREKHQGTYKEVSQIKSKVIKDKRNVVLLRDILMRISSRKIGAFSESGQQSLSLLFSRSQMVANQADAIRDILNSILDFIDNSLMQKINKSIGIIKTIAAIFLPLFALTGLYNLNQRRIPQDWTSQINWNSGLVYSIIAITIAVLVVIVIKKKKT